VVQVDDRFVVERLAASGGMGRVFRARDSETHEVVALKVLDAGAGGMRSRALERFAREARLLAQIRHPGVVRFVAFGTTAHGEPYLAMEWLDGETLAARLARGPLSVEEAIVLARRVASALASAHSAGVVHRDVKPSNVLLVGGDVEQAKIIDFGIARFAPLVTDVTRPGGVLGTPGYMAPEQARALRDVDSRADVYALGCVLFRALAGRLPFEGEDALSVLAKILLERTPRLRDLAPGVPPALDDLVARMLSKDPGGRPRDGAALLQELESLDTGVREAAPSLRAGALGGGEQRFVSLVVVPGGTPASHDTDAPTLVEGIDAAPARVSSAVARFGGELEQLADGSLVAALGGYGSATDQATQAARCALALREALPGAPVVLATGRAERTEGAPAGEVIDRAAKLALHARERAATDGAVLVDDVTAALLDARFDLAGTRDAHVLALRGEREPTEATRQLLGRPVPCIGRERELTILRSAIDESREEHAPRAVLVTAAAGIGKSRLRHELLRELRAAGDALEVWTARGDPMSAGAPFGMVGQVLRSAIGLVEGEAPAARRRKLRARVARHVARGDRERVTAFLGELLGAPAEEEGVEVRVARQDPMLMGDQLRRAWETFLAAECGAHPVLVVLEDLHWGDVPSVRFFDVALALENAALTTLALARPEVHDVFPRLWAERATQEVRLPPLGKRAAESLVRHALGAAVRDDMVGRIVERAAGNAFFLEELVRAAATDAGDALPETVLAMVQARLEKLDADERRLLRGASVLGRTFWRGGAAALLGEGEGGAGAGDVDGVLERLLARELVSRRATSSLTDEVEYAFRHEIVREAAYAMLTDRDRRTGHALAAAWLEQRAETPALVLAEHWERGGDLTRAQRGYERAAAQALEGNDFEAALARAERGVACGAHGDALGRLRLLQAEAHRWRGDLRSSRAAAIEAYGLLNPGQARWYEAVGLLGLMSSALGDIGWVVTLCERLLEARPSTLPRDAQDAYLVAAGRIASQLFYSGRHEIGSRLLAHVDAELPACQPGPTAMAALAFGRGVRAVSTADYGAALTELRAARVEFERAGDVRAQAMVLGNVAYVHMLVGHFEDAVDLLRLVAALSRRLGLQHAMSGVKHNLGLALARAGQLEEALETERSAVELLAAQGNHRVAAGARAYLASILMARGDLEAAEHEAQAAVDLPNPSPSVRALTLATLSDVQLARGAAGPALASAEQAMAQLETIETDEHEAYVRLVLARALRATGDTERARATVHEALARLEKRAACIGDPALRESFLGRVPENAATRALAKELGVGE
jgi:tetratricopeptide (TPR) repeat protein